MAAPERREIEQLDAYWASLEWDPLAAPPEGLDPELARTAQRLMWGLRPPEPRPTFVAALRRQLQAPAPGAARGQGWAATLRRLAPSRRAGLARLATAAVVVLALAVASLSIVRPQPVSAQPIIDKAQQVAASPAAGGVRSYVLTEGWRVWPGRIRPNAQAAFAGLDVIVSESQRWYQAPNLWRTEYHQRIVRSDGTTARTATSLQVSDGQDLWLYDADANQVMVNRLSPGLSAREGIAALAKGANDQQGWLQGTSNLSALLQRACTCYTPRVTGSATVAGRSTYVIDLGPSRCPSAASPGTNGRAVIWVDKETFFVLKQELYSEETKQLFWQGEVVSVQYSVTVDPALFTFTPPAGASVLDGRLQPTAPAPEPTPAPALPGPTGMPTPAFKALRPAWLPEAMAVREEVDGDIVTLSFDPRPGDGPHPVLTLVEMPVAMISPGGSPDPQATHETIGGRDVTVIHRGAGCTALTWQEGGIAFSLSNVYDPPGQLKYTCDELRRIVESLG